MKLAKDLLPWKVIDLGLRPYDGFWSMNPSIHYDGEIWRCNLRCCDYAMPGGKTIRSPKAGPGHQSKNALVVLDPQTWKPIKIYKMRELDEYPRTATPNVGFEDMRLFKTDRGGLQGIAASLHLKRDTRPSAGGSQHQPPEQVLLSFDVEYNIVEARPIRGDWGSSPQKNWVPVDGAAEPRFVYAIDKGTLFDDRGRVHGDDARLRPSVNARPIVEQRAEPVVAAPRQEEPPSPSQAEEKISRQEEKAKKSPSRDLRATGRGAETMVRGRRVSHDTVTSRPSYAPRAGAVGGMRVNTEGARMGGGRTLMPRYEGLRGGTQLVRVGEDQWLGIAHEMCFDAKRLKLYWHTWYTTNSKGKMTAASESMKLVSDGIEFAAGLAIDGDRAVVSFGVDDMKSLLGETSLSAVMEQLKPVEE